MDCGCGWKNLTTYSLVKHIIYVVLLYYICGIVKHIILLFIYVVVQRMKVVISQDWLIKSTHIFQMNWCVFYLLVPEPPNPSSSNPVCEKVINIPANRSNLLYMQLSPSEFRCSFSPNCSDIYYVFCHFMKRKAIYL